MRLGLIGLGRIGAFHTNTQVGIPAIDSPVVTDIVPEKAKTIVTGRRGSSAPSAPLMGRFQPAFRAEAADGPEADWITEACARSQKEHRTVRIEEVRIS